MTTVYGLYRTGKEAPKFEAFASAEIARKSGNGFNIVKEQDCLADTRLFPTGFLVDIYNTKAERKISKFRDRATAESRVWKMLTDQEAPQVEETVDAAEDSKQYMDAKKKEKSSSSPRRVFKGQMVKALGASNPRRKGTNAWHSWNILKQNGPMIYDDFIAKGGRRPDFAYDVNHGWAEVYAK